MPTKRTTTTTTKNVEEVNPTEEVAVNETPTKIEEDFNLEKKSYCKKYCRMDNRIPKN